MPPPSGRDSLANEPAFFVAIMLVVAILFGGLATLLDLCVVPTGYRPILFSLLIFLSILSHSLITAYFKHRHLKDMERDRQETQERHQQQIMELLNREEVKKVLSDTSIPQEVRDSYWKMLIAPYEAYLHSQGYDDKIPQTQHLHGDYIIMSGNQYKAGNITNSPGTNVGADNTSIANSIQQMPDSTNKEILRQIQEQLERSQLSPQDKEDALYQIIVLAEMPPQPTPVQRSSVRAALTFLSNVGAGMVANLISKFVL